MLVFFIIIIVAAAILDTLKSKYYDYQDISLYGLNTLNVFFRENQQNPEAQPMVFDMVTRMLDLYFVEDIDGNINQKYNRHYHIFTYFFFVKCVNNIAKI